MSKKVSQLLELYQNNTFPGMRDSLSASLGVSQDSIERLGIGWAPIVSFKNGYNYGGWWVIPERDSTGEPSGLSLRSVSGKKTMLPGTKHGLIYEVNPEHGKGSLPKVHWLRLSEVNVDCPVCGKPDGCLVSSDDPYSPQAAVCIRVKDGSIRHLGLGYLHHLKPHKTVGASPLPDSDLPVVVVEGMTDTAAAMDLGFVAVGRPSNLAGMSALTDLLRGRDAVIIGENDDINPITKQRPGHEGAIASMQVLKKVCPSVRLVFPPEHIKDLREWVKAGGLTAEGLLSAAQEDGREPTDMSVLPDVKPLTMARAWLDSNYRMAGRYLLRHHADRWWLYEGCRYREAHVPTEIRGSIHGWAYDKKAISISPNGSQTVNDIICTTGTVNNVMDALLEDCPVKTEKIPTWINHAKGPDPLDLIAFDNGILWVSKYIEGCPESEYLLDSSPDYFTTFALPFSFDPTATAPLWNKYLFEALGDSWDKIDLLQEWFGYCLTSDTSYQKMLLMRGPKRSGKSTAISMLQEIIGAPQYSAITFAELSSPHGLENLVGKQVAIMGDARLPHRSDSMKALEVLLNILGEDEVSVNPKFQKHTSQKLHCRFTMATNELPELPDHSGALEARLNIIDFRNSFLGREDFDLRKKLATESAGVTVWALEGLKRLRERGRFVTPESSLDALREWRMATSPTAAFVEECCDIDQAKQIGKREMYDTWTLWSRERGMRPIARSKFQERFKSVAPYVISESQKMGGVYTGIKLKDWAAQQYNTARL